LEAGEKIGKYETLLPILQIYDKGLGPEMPEISVLPFIVKGLVNFDRWATGKSWYAAPKANLDSLVASLNKEVVRIGGL